MKVCSVKIRRGSLVRDLYSLVFFIMEDKSSSMGRRKRARATAEKSRRS